MTISEHHIWCNYFMRNPTDCSQCARLWEKYPYETNEEANSLVGKHFPDVVELR